MLAAAFTATIFIVGSCANHDILVLENWIEVDELLKFGIVRKGDLLGWLIYLRLNLKRLGRLIDRYQLDLFLFDRENSVDSLAQTEASRLAIIVNHVDLSGNLPDRRHTLVKLSRIAPRLCLSAPLASRVVLGFVLV